MKQAWLSKIAGTALICCTLVIPATAAPPDFAICEGLTGAAWGLCRGGVAAGCADGTGNPTACMRIEDNFVSVTGVDAPWITPTVTCPCDYMVDVPIDTAWAGVARAGFSCPPLEASVVAASEEPQTPQVAASITNQTPPQRICLTAPTPDAGVTIPISDAELSLCRDDVIQYGLSLLAAEVPGLTIDDACSETLP